MTKEMITKRIKELKTQIKYEKNKMKICAYGKSDLMYLYGLEQELEELNKKLEDKNMSKIITNETIETLINAYESNKDTLYSLDKILEEYGVLDNGVSDIHDTFEMGYNNALQYVFSQLGIKDYDKE